VARAPRGGGHVRRRAYARRVVRALLVLAALGFPACRSSPSPPAVPYNVLIVSLDTVRQDVLGAYGHRPRHAPDVDTSPALTRLAGQGVRMADAYASSSWTLPSHIALMTGRPGIAHAVESEGAVLDPAVPTLAEILQKHGYGTAGIYSAPYLDPYWGFARGFDSYLPVYGSDPAGSAARLAALRTEAEQAAAAGDWSRYDDIKRRQSTVEEELNYDSQIVVTSPQVAEATIAQLNAFARDGRPWFLFAHFFDAHCDYVPPPPYDTRFDPAYAGTFTAGNCMGDPSVGTPHPDRPGALVRALGDRDLEHAYALYEGEVAWVDHHLGMILEALDRTGMTDHTLVIVVSDHGEEFFEHDGIGHRRTLYEEMVRIPMVLRLPDVLPKDRVVSGPVSLPDVLPTVLELLGLRAAPPPGARSFVAAMRSGRPVEHPPLFRTVMMFGGEVRVDDGTPVTMRQVIVQDGFRDGTIKVLRRRSWPQFQAGLPPATHAILHQEAAAQYAREELRWIDLARFPTEPRAEYSTDFGDAAARDALAAFRRAYEAGLDHRPRVNRTAPLPRNIRSKLESLGYLERERGPSFPEPDLVLPVPGDPSTAPRSRHDPEGR
jgi:arylsulfatase A-like enzyme